MFKRTVDYCRLAVMVCNIFVFTSAYHSRCVVFVVLTRDLFLIGWLCTDLRQPRGQCSASKLQYHSRYLEFLAGKQIPGDNSHSNRKTCVRDCRPVAHFSYSVAAQLQWHWDLFLQIGPVAFLGTCALSCYKANRLFYFWLCRRAFKAITQFLVMLPCPIILLYQIHSDGSMYCTCKCTLYLLTYFSTLICLCMLRLCSFGAACRWLVVTVVMVTTRWVMTVYVTKDINLRSSLP